MQGQADTANESVRNDLDTKGGVLKKDVPYQEWYDPKETFKIPLYHRRVTKGGRTIIDKPTYQKITKRITKKGAFITTADEKWLKRLEDQGATAVTIGDNIILRPDATVTEVLEEVYHFEQNKKKLNHQWEHSVMRTLNEIDAQKYLIAVADKYKIPLKEREETLALLKKYEEELEQHRKDGHYYD